SMNIFAFMLLLPRGYSDLHSFPTRRSSDLGKTIRHGRTSFLSYRFNYKRGCPSFLLFKPIYTKYCTSSEAKRTLRDLGCGPRERSEEHTSELQSRFDLVCRLLLEKKQFTK